MAVISNCTQQNIEADIDPADDPNNQGEDEFEEAEQQVHEEEEEEEPVPPGHADTHLIKQNQQQGPADEHLVVSPMGRGSFFFEPACSF